MKFNTKRLEQIAELVAEEASGKMGGGGWAKGLAGFNSGGGLRACGEDSEKENNPFYILHWGYYKPTPPVIPT